MARARGDFADILLKKKLIGPDQLAEAENIASQTGMKLQDAIIKQQYLSANEVMSTIAEFYNIASGNEHRILDLTDITLFPALGQVLTTPLSDLPRQGFVEYDNNGVAESRFVSSRVSSAASGTKSLKMPSRSPFITSTWGSTTS